MISKVYIISTLLIKIALCDNLTVFRDKYQYFQYNSSIVLPLLLCISNNPKDAIIWNDDLNWTHGNQPYSDRNFFQESKISKTSHNIDQECKIDVDDPNCFAKWNQYDANWKSTHSFDVPMGPVYDSRWEYHWSNVSTPIMKYQHGITSTLTFRQTGALVFSVRGPENAQILLCESDNYTKDFCYWLIIGGWKNSLTVMRKCEDGIPEVIPAFGSKCAVIRALAKHNPLSIYEWNTFILTWEENSRTLKLFDPDKLILEYKDDDYVFSTNSTKLYHVFYRYSYEGTLFRFHNYSYILAIQPGANLKSQPLTIVNSEEVCIDMLVGLCKHCELLVNIIDASGKQLMTKKISRSSIHKSIEHNLPMWQNEQIKANVLNIPITLELMTVLSSNAQNNEENHWAITKFEECFPQGTVKSIEMMNFQDFHTESFWPNASCQKFSYDRTNSELVYSHDTLSERPDDVQHCPIYYIGPHCATNCRNYFQNNCDSIAVCTKSGCYCSEGTRSENSSECNTAPSHVVGLKAKFVGETKAVITWQSPVMRNDILQGYNLTIKVLFYRGCRAKDNTPTHLLTSKYLTNISPSVLVSYIIPDLVPYVSYKVTVVAFTSQKGNESSITFNTLQQKIPTAIFSNMSFLNNKISWRDPIDCSTISGPIAGAKIFLFGVSENVKNFYDEHVTQRQAFELNITKLQDIHGNERYRMRIHVLHELLGVINETAYTELIFTTDPRLPPKVRELGLTDVDEQNTTLRWKVPYPPTEGDIIYYTIGFVGKNGEPQNVVKVYPNETCYIWRDSICKTVTHPVNNTEYIEVKAYNKGVNDPGETSRIYDIRNLKVPQAPYIVSAQVLNNATMRLKWHYHLITDNMIERFIIYSRVISTELERNPWPEDVKIFEHSISLNHTEYHTDLTLLPSTRFVIAIQGITKKLSGKLSSIEIETKPSLKFAYDPQYNVSNESPLINIIIPPIINNIIGSMLHIIVKGPSKCIEGGRVSPEIVNYIEIGDNEEAWRVVIFPTHGRMNLSFTIGDDLIYDSILNCPLQPGNLYSIIIVVQGKKYPGSLYEPQTLVWESQPIRVGSKPKHHEYWLIPLVLIVIVAAGLYYHRWRNAIP